MILPCEYYTAFSTTVQIVTLWEWGLTVLCTPDTGPTSLSWLSPGMEPDDHVLSYGVVLRTSNIKD